jgi:hypothetical protein
VANPDRDTVYSNDGVNRTVYTRESNSTGWFVGIIVALALLAIAYLVFSANSQPSTVDVNNSPTVTTPAPADTLPAPADTTTTPMAPADTTTTPMAPADTTTTPAPATTAPADTTAPAESTATSSAAAPAESAASSASAP